MLASPLTLRILSSKALDVAEMESCKVLVIKQQLIDIFEALQLEVDSMQIHILHKATYKCLVVNGVN